ncbi:hypothetical protein LCGC14_1088280 [marine sediment metagenome]|uniref:Uncharacterized protein n=1 Tax=marine sediment metagenome TaxID=412755 RepID=A0A0F9PWD4_9ZZZZ
MLIYLISHFQIVAHGCHFRVMFKTKGYSANNSLKRRAIIVDAPDLPPDECEFFITAAGVADTDKVDIPDTPGLDFEVEKLYEEEGSSSESQDSKLISVKGIGKGTVEGLGALGIASITDLVNADPNNLSSKLSGASSKMVLEWQKNAQGLIKA